MAPHNRQIGERHVFVQYWGRADDAASRSTFVSNESSLVVGEELQNSDKGQYNAEMTVATLIDRTGRTGL